MTGCPGAANRRFGGKSTIFNFFVNFREFFLDRKQERVYSIDKCVDVYAKPVSSIILRSEGPICVYDTAKSIIHGGIL
jgi:hypothetical protein